MNSETYRKALESALEEFESALAEEEKIQEKILSLRKTINALSVLCEEAGEAEDLREHIVTAFGVSWPRSVTDDILSVVTAAYPVRLTTSDVRDELKKLGTLDNHKNPLATINAVLKRLTEQGKVKQTIKDGRKVWEPAYIPMSTRGSKAGMAGMLNTNSPSPSKWAGFLNTKKK